jgi:hypothetical protein
LSLFKRFVKKTISKHSIITWRSYFDYIGFQNSIFAFIQAYASLFAKEMFYKSDL